MKIDRFAENIKWNISVKVVSPGMLKSSIFSAIKKISYLKRKEQNKKK